jgi:hypothetical protein
MHCNAFVIRLGFIADYLLLPLKMGLNWRLMLGLGCVMPSILIVLVLTVMPESPRWLCLKGRHEEVGTFASPWAALLSTSARCSPNRLSLHLGCRVLSGSPGNPWSGE